MFIKMTIARSKGKRGSSRDQHSRVERLAQRAAIINSTGWFSPTLQLGGKGKLFKHGRHLGVCRPSEEEEELEPDTPLEPGGHKRVSLGQEDEVQEQRSRSCNQILPCNLVDPTVVSLEQEDEVQV